MLTKQVVDIIKIIKAFLSKYLNRQALVFLFFLALSATFWMFQSLDMDYEREYKVPLHLINIPENVVITTDLPQTLSVTLKDKGVTLLGYAYGKKLPHITLDFAALNNNTGHIRLLSANITRQVLAQLNSTTHVVSVLPDTLELYYNHGMHKRVPVKIMGEVTSNPFYYIASVHTLPDSVTVYALPAQLDTITAAFTNHFNYSNISDTLKVRTGLKKQKGIKFEPSTVLLAYNTDQLTEKQVKVPVTTLNLPPDRVVRTFPSKVNVTFQVGTKMYQHITAEDFDLYIDYNTIKSTNSNRATISLATIPIGVTHVTINPEQVEYVIEQIEHPQRLKPIASTTP